MPKWDLHRRDFIRFGGSTLTLPLLTGFSSVKEGALGSARDQAIQLVGNGVPSLSVAVFHRGSPLWIEAFGWADRERQIKASIATPYAIASAAKPFTGMAVAQLVKSGRMGLDATIESYLQGVRISSDNTAPVTIRQALQHRTGLPRHWRNFFAGQGRPPPFSSVVQDHAFTTAAHDKRYLYSNTNYGLLAAAVEAVTGAAFHAHLKDALFRPLALTSAAPINAPAGQWNAAVPYENDGVPIPAYEVDEKGARDLVMSASDLARFGLAHLERRWGAVSDLMLSERASINTNAIGKASYGLGWIVEEESPAALFSYGHTGEGPGAAASLTIVPEDRLVVATIANQQGAPAYLLNEAIVDALSTRFAARRKAHPFQEEAPDEEALRGLAGRWSGELRTPAGVHGISVTLASGAASRIVVAEEQASLTHLSVRDGVMTGRADLSVPTPGAQRFPHQARIALEQSGDGLDGTLAAHASRGKAPHDQFWLSYRLRLRRT